MTESGKARSTINGTRHGRTGRTFFLLADEDPAVFAAHEASWLAIWRPRDRADRLEAQILSDRFGADGIEDEALRLAVKAAAMKALVTLLRYRAQITRENAAAMRDLGSLRQRRLDLPQPPRQSEPEVPPVRAAAALPPAASSAAPSRPPLFTASKGAMAALPSEPETTLNRHQRRALAARARHAA